MRRANLFILKTVEISRSRQFGSASVGNNVAQRGVLSFEGGELIGKLNRLRYFLLSIVLATFSGIVPVMGQQYNVADYAALKNAIAGVAEEGTGTITIRANIDVNDDLFVVDAGKSITFLLNRTQFGFNGGDIAPLLSTNGTASTFFENRAEGVFDMFTFEKGLRSGSPDLDNPLFIDGGGAVRVVGMDRANVALTRFNTNTSFDHNRSVMARSSGGYGGAVFAQFGIVDFYGETVSFTANTAEFMGGAVAGADGSVITFGRNDQPATEAMSVLFGGYETDGTTIDAALANSAESGGAIFAINDAAFVFNVAASFLANKATVGGGGAIETAFDAGPDGEAIQGIPYFHFLEKAIFAENQSVQSGGAINAVGAMFTFDDYSLFRDNKTLTGSGGALNITKGATVRFNHSARFSGNAANGRGGAIYISDPGSSAFLNPKSGDVVFGSRDGTLKNTVSGGANSVFITNDGALYIEPEGTRKIGTETIRNAVYFYDPIAGDDGSVVKLGSGDALFWGDNDYTGDTIVRNGRFILIGDTLRPDGTVETPGATYGNIVKKGNITIADTGLLQIADGNAVRALNLDFQGGTIFITGGTNGGLSKVGISQNTAVLDIPVVSLEPNEDGSMPGGTFNVDTGVVFVLSSELHGSGQLIKTGEGTLILSNPGNIFTGLTVVDTGVLQAYNPGSGASARSDHVLSRSAGLQLLGTSVFDLNDTNQRLATLSGEIGTRILMESTIDEDPFNVLTIFPGTLDDTNPESVFHGVISGNGMLEKRGDGAITLTNTNTFTGGTVLERGKILVGNKDSLGVYDGSAAGLIVARESYGQNDTTAAPYKEIGNASEKDLTLQNRFAVLTPSAAEPTDSLTLDAYGKTLTIAGNVTNDAVSLLLPNAPNAYVLKTDGGAFHVESRGELDFRNADPASRYVITRNVTVGNGGAIYFGGPFTLNPSGSALLISENRGMNGGALFGARDAGITIRNGTTFLDNKADRNGGAVYLTGGRNGNAPARSLVYSNDPERPILFRGNTVGNGTASRNNSFYLENFNELTFQTDAGCLIQLDDPIESKPDNPLSGDDIDNLVVKTGDGTLLLHGALPGTYGYYGNTTVREGRFELESTAETPTEYGRINENFENRFLVESTGTLAGWGTVRASDFSVLGTLDVAAELNLESRTTTFDGAKITGSGTLGVIAEPADASPTADVALKNVLYGDVTYGNTVTVDASLAGASNIVNRGQGTLLLAQDTTLTVSGSSLPTGVLNVQRGTVAVGDGSRAASFRSDSVSVKSGGTAKVNNRSQLRTRELTAAPGGTLSVALNTNEKPAIVVDEIATIASANLDITGYAGQFGVDDLGKRESRFILMRALAYNGDFKRITLAGREIDETSFITLVTRSEENEVAGTVDYVAVAGLAWYAGNNTAHGTFDLETEFTLDTDLVDVGSTGPWNGKSLVKTGSGVLTLTGTNSYTGGTRVGEGTLAGTVKSLQGNIEIAGGAVLHFIETTDGTFTGPGGAEAIISGGGRVLVDGRLTLNGTHTYGGSTTIGSGGVLSADGTFRNSAFHVLENGILFAGGTIKSLAVEKNGVFSPGAMGGTGNVQVLDKLVFNEGSIYRVNIDPDGKGDRTTVMKTADLSGATLEIAGTEGKTAADYTAVQYGATIVSADEGLLESRFKEAFTTGALTGYYADVFYENRAAHLVLVDKNFSFRKYSGSYTATSVANAFDKIVAKGTDYGKFSPLFSRLRDLEPDHMGSAMREIGGPVKANAMMLGQWNVGRRTFEQLNLERLDERRIRGTLNNYWIDSFYESTEGLGDGNSHSYGIGRTGFLMGVDRRWTTSTLVGLVFGYSRPILQNEGDKVEGHDFQAGLYIGQVLPLGSELKGYVGFGGQGYDSCRWLRDPAVFAEAKRLTADYQGDSFNMSVELSRPFRLGRYGTIRPVAGLDIMTTTHGGHTESGDAVLAGDYARVHFGRAFTRYGARAKYENDFTSIWFQMFCSFKFAGEDAPETKFKFVGAPGEENVIVRGVDPGSLYLLMGLGGHFDLNKKKTRKLAYAWDFSVAERLVSNAGTLGFVQLF
ncbi:MAG TPA: hypothetical protein DEB39_04780 [Planctomycetaceae bacterium]|nr:hypothetical protein [Planctomycetaceae bacterium]